MRSAFEGVAFAYPGSDRAVLDELDLTIPAGASLAIVGLNGAGKTTLVKLLARLYEPHRGPHHRRRRRPARASTPRRGSAGCRDLPGLRALRAARRRQRRLRRAGAPRRRAATRVGARARAGAAALVDALPHGLGRPSRAIRRAAPTSPAASGSASRSPARCSRSRPARGVLVLDEPTANLDVRAEAELFDRFLELTAGLTTILISHRFSTVRRADRIVVLEDGARRRGRHPRRAGRARRPLRGAVPAAGRAVRRERRRRGDALMELRPRPACAIFAGGWRPAPGGRWRARRARAR